MIVQAQFRRFYADINITPPQLRDAKSKYSRVCKLLHNYYYPESTYDGKTKRLIGSYGNQTHTQSTKDVDVIFIMPQGVFVRYGTNTAQLLDDIHDILLDEFPNSEVCIDRMVVRVEFVEGGPSIEVLPVCNDGAGLLVFPSTEEGGQWMREKNPVELIKKIASSNSETSRTSKLIRIVKTWREFCGAQLKSYQIEDAVLDFFQSGERETTWYSILVRDFFKYFHQKAQGTEDINLQSHTKDAAQKAGDARKFEESKNIAKAIEVWRDLFGPGFPEPV